MTIMTYRALSIKIAFALLVLLPTRWAQAEPAKVTITGDSTEINGKKMFGISVAVIPPPDGKTPEGKSAWQEFADAGVNLARIVPGQQGENYGWTDKGYDVARQYLDSLAAARMYAWLW